MERQALITALDDAGRAHHEFESVALGGDRDPLWAGFYGAYVLGRLGDFMDPSALAALLENVDGEPWSEVAADAVIEAATR